MHCWKTINVQYEYGTTRLFLLSAICFILVFCFSYIGLSFNYAETHHDQHFMMTILITPFIYPLHKALHFMMLVDYRKSIAFRLKIRHHFVPVVHMRLLRTIPKWRYVIVLLMPFILLNSVLIILGIYVQHLAHYISFFLAFHTSICLIDLLYVKHLLHAPKNAVVEETPRGYEILVPTI
ncbi:MAG: DUF3267 domain-containing protein [Solibacillus sp.]